MLYGPLYYVFVHIMSCELGTMEIQYLQLINQYETGLLDLFY